MFKYNQSKINTDTALYEHIILFRKVRSDPTFVNLDNVSTSLPT